MHIPGLEAQHREKSQLSFVTAVLSSDYHYGEVGLIQSISAARQRRGVRGALRLVRRKMLRRSRASLVSLLAVLVRPLDGWRLLP
jgi:hypothetical protein